MKIAVILNTLNNFHHSKMGLDVTLSNAGEDFDLFWNDNGSTNDRIKEAVRAHKPKWSNESSENLGNPVAYNQMLLRVHKEYDYVMMIAPDVVLPNRWLSLCKEVYTRCSLEGLLGFEWGLPQQKEMKIIEGVPLKRCDNVFGCWFFSTKFLDKVGFINEEYKVYGKWDSDLNFRANALGIDSYYLPVSCVHLTCAWMNGGEYRKMKDKHLRHNEEVFKQQILQYAKTNDFYIAPPEEIELNKPIPDKV